MRIEGFDWDVGNIEKVKKHGLPIKQIEEFLSTDPFVWSDNKHNYLESRFIAFGEFNGRFLFVAFTIRAGGSSLKIRVISARFAHLKEVKKYYEEIKNQEK